MKKNYLRKICVTVTAVLICFTLAVGVSFTKSKANAENTLIPKDDVLSYVNVSTGASANFGSKTIYGLSTSAYDDSTGGTESKPHGFGNKTASELLNEKAFGTKEVSGLVLSGKEGSEFKYDKKIDLSKLGWNSKEDYSQLISLYYAPSPIVALQKYSGDKQWYTDLVSEIDMLTITLTDAKNSARKVVVDISSGGSFHENTVGSPNGYVSTYAVDEDGTQTEGAVRGNNQEIFKSFIPLKVGTAGNNEIPFTLVYDMENNSTYTPNPSAGANVHEIIRNYGTPYNVSGITNDGKDTGVVFKGFSGNEAYLSIKFTSLRKGIESSSIVLTNLGGQDLVNGVGVNTNLNLTVENGSSSVNSGNAIIPVGGLDVKFTSSREALSYNGKSCGYLKYDELKTLKVNGVDYVIEGKEVNGFTLNAENGSFNFKIQENDIKSNSVDVKVVFDKKCHAKVDGKDYEFWRSDGFTPPITTKNSLENSSAYCVGKDGEYDKILIGYGVEDIKGASALNLSPAEKYYFNDMTLTSVYLKVRSYEKMYFSSSSIAKGETSLYLYTQIESSGLADANAYGIEVINAKYKVCSIPDVSGTLSFGNTDIEAKNVTTLNGLKLENKNGDKVFGTSIKVKFSGANGVYQSVSAIDVKYSNGEETLSLFSEPRKTSLNSTAKTKLGTPNNFGVVFSKTSGNGYVRDFKINGITYYTSLNKTQLDSLYSLAGYNDLGGFVDTHSHEFINGKCIFCDEEEKDTVFYANGKTEYVIVKPSRPTDAENYSASELQYFLKDATGITFPIVLDSGLSFDENKKYISVGNTALYKGSPLNGKIDNSLGYDGYRIVTYGRTIIVNAFGDNGIIYGAYGFLQYFMDYDYYYTDCWDIFRGSEKYIKTVDITEHPDFESRYLDTATNGAEPMAYRIRMREHGSQNSAYNGFEGGAWILSDQSLCEQLLLFENDSNTGYYDLGYTSWYNVLPSFQAHKPFANSYNYRRTTQLCIATVLENQATSGKAGVKYPLDELTNALISKIKSNPKARVFMLGINDNDKASCSCAKCSRQVGQIGYSGQMILLANELSKNIEEWQNSLSSTDSNKTRPISLSIFAYKHCIYAPGYDSATGNFRQVYYDYDGDGENDLYARDNVIIRIAPISSVKMHTHYDKSYNKESAEAFKYWSNYAKNFAVWDYGTTFSDYVSPFPDWDIIQKDLQFYKGVNDEISSEIPINVTELLTQLPAHTSGTSFFAYTIYLRSKLMWNVNENVEELTEKFFKAYYGEGYKDMLDYFNYLKARYKQMDEGGIVNADGSTAIFHGYIYTVFTSPVYFPYETVNEMKAFFDRAFSKVYAGSVYYDRIMKESVFYRYLQLKCYSSNYEKEEVERLIDEFEAAAKLAKYTKISNHSRDGSMSVANFIQSKRDELEHLGDGSLVYALQLNGSTKSWCKLVDTDETKVLALSGEKKNNSWQINEVVPYTSSASVNVNYIYYPNTPHGTQKEIGDFLQKVYDAGNNTVTTMLYVGTYGGAYYYQKIEAVLVSYEVCTSNAHFDNLKGIGRSYKIINIITSTTEVLKKGYGYIPISDAPVEVQSKAKR